MPLLQLAVHARRLLTLKDLGPPLPLPRLPRRPPHFRECIVKVPRILRGEYNSIVGSLMAYNSKILPRLTWTS